MNAQQLAAIAAAAAMGSEDRAQRTKRTVPHMILLDAAERAGHPRTTTHPGTYGYCDILDGARSEILAAYWDAVEA